MPNSSAVASPPLSACAVLAGDDVGRVTQPHEAWIGLLREQPDLVLDLIRRSTERVPVPAVRGIAVVGSEVIKARPESVRADLVLRLGTAEAPRLSIVVEVQLSQEADKRYSWPLYVAGVRAELRCPVVLVVIAPGARVARWARSAIETGHPGFALRPIVLGPAEIPIVTDAREAGANVRLALVSAMAHGDGARAYEVGLAALAAIERVDESRRGDYYSWVLDALDEAVVRRVEEEMEQGRHRELTSLEKHFIAKGEARAKQQAILRVLAVRGIDVPGAVQETILGCQEAAELDAWLSRAVMVERAEDVVRD